MPIKTHSTTGKNKHRLFLSQCIVGMTLIFALSGCATHNPRDPLEPYNRKVFAFNRVVDKYTTRPIAVVYHAITPHFINVGVTHFFANLAEVNAIANDILQFRLGYTLSDTWRLLINSTVGIAGLFDVATEIGLPKHRQDFGLTLARWGIKQSPYFMIPLLGPSTLRDTLAMPVDYCVISFWPYLDHDHALHAGLTALHIIDIRADLLPADKLVDKAFDPYVFVREAYLQKREGLISHHNQQHKQNHLENEALDLDALSTE